MGASASTLRQVKGGEEVWAQRILNVALGAVVEVHDDNSVDSMYDLRVGPADAPTLAVEVVGAVDPVWTETWNVGPARSDLVWDGRSDWIVTIRPGARLRQIRQELPRVVASLEALGISEWTVHDHFSVASLAALPALGVNSVRRMGEGTGKIHLTMSGQGGAVHSDGNLVPQWIAEFLTSDKRADVVYKLRAANAERREVFVAVTLSGAPWPVTSYLTGSLDQLPGACPILPLGVDGVWLAATLSFGRALGVRWDGVRWSTFRTRGDGIEN